MKGEITSGGKEVYVSGNFITFNDQSSTISFSRGKEKVSFLLEFIENPDQKTELTFNTEKTGEDFQLKIRLKNFDHPLGVGLREPLPIAQFDNKDQIYLSFWVRRLNSEIKSREITYTVYVEEKNGKY